MKALKHHAWKSNGFSLIEVLIAMAVLSIGLAALLNMFTLAVGLIANQGEAAARATEYAQNKMEQLLALGFGDGATNTTVYPSTATGGTGLGGNMAPSTTVGSATGPVVNGHADYLSATGKLLPGSEGASYVRQWSISTNSTATLKTITVLVSATHALGPGNPPSTTLVSYKSQTQ